MDHRGTRATGSAASHNGDEAFYIEEIGCLYRGRGVKGRHCFTFIYGVLRCLLQDDRAVRYM